MLPVTAQTSEFAYLRQSVRNNLAAVVPEGSVKPTSVYSVVRVEDKLEVIAHLSEAVPRLWFVNSPALQQFLSNELTYGLALRISIVCSSSALRRLSARISAAASEETPSRCPSSTCC